MRTSTLPGTGFNNTRPPDHDPGWNNRKNKAVKKPAKKPNHKSTGAKNDRQ